MAKEVFLSVIVPVYNVKEYVCECLDSLLFQTKHFEEIIIVDDGSTDGSEQICKEYCEKNENIVLIHQDNQGLSAARNVGLRNAHGRYVIFVDSDDLVSPNMHLCLYGRLINEDLDILYYNANILDETGKGYNEATYIRDRQLNDYTMTGMDFFDKSYPKDYMVNAWLAAYKKSFLMYYSIVFPYGLYYEDNAFFIQTVLRAHKVKSMSECLYTRRYRFCSITLSDLTEKKCRDFLEIHFIIWKYLYSYEFKLRYWNLYKHFVLNNILYIHNFIKEYRYEKKIQERLDELMNFFMQYWIPFLDTGEINWSDIYTLLLIVCYQAGTEICNTIMMFIDRKISGKLNLLPLKCAGRKIGIYGTGKHTETMITLYEHYVGKICCELYFVETLRNKDVYMGKQVVSCDEISKDTDWVIVSSLRYEKEILRKLQSKNIKRDKIILLYNGDDEKDLVQIADLINRRNGEEK